MPKPETIAYSHKEEMECKYVGTMQTTMHFYVVVCMTYQFAHNVIINRYNFKFQNEKQNDYASLII